MTTYKPRVYTASKLAKYKLWMTLREDPDWDFIHWTASWPAKVEAGEEESSSPADFARHWRQDLAEIADSDFVLLYGRNETNLRGALVECGAALADRIRVVAIGLDPGHTWSYHNLVTRVDTLVEARIHLYRYTIAAKPRSTANDQSPT